MRARGRARTLAIGCIGACAFLATAILFLWDQKGVRVSVENATQPPALLTVVEVSVRGDVSRIGDIPYGGRRSIRLHPQGESDVTLSFILEGRPHLVTDGYVETSGGYRAEFVVRERGAVLMRDSDAPLHRVSE